MPKHLKNPVGRIKPPTTQNRQAATTKALLDELEKKRKKRDESVNKRGK